MSTNTESWDPPTPAESNKKWPQHPKGAFRFVLVDALRLGGKVDRKWNKVTERVALIYESEKYEPVWDDATEAWVPQTSGKRFQIKVEMGYSATEKSHLPKWFAQWLDLPADTDEQRERLVSEIPSYIGKSGIGTVTHNVSGDRTYVNLKAMAPLMDGMEPLAMPKDYQRSPYYDKLKARYAEEVAAYRKEQAAAAKAPKSGPSSKASVDFSDVPPAVADDGGQDLPF